MQDYHKLIVWKQSTQLVKLTYRLVRLFPRDELFGLTSQLKRSIVSVTANIVEGRGKKSDKDFLKFLYIANGSLDESRCYYEIALDLEFITQVQYNYIENKRKEVGYLLYKLIDSIEKSQQIQQQLKQLTAS